VCHTNYYLPNVGTSENPSFGKGTDLFSSVYLYEVLYLSLSLLGPNMPGTLAPVAYMVTWGQIYLHQ